MLWTFVVAASLAAPKPAPPLKLAAPGLSGLNVSTEELEFYSEHLAQQLTISGLQVITSKQISSLLGLERQKALLGCKEDATACMAELASALGVDGVVVGSIGKFEKSYRVNVSIVAATDGRTLSAQSMRAGSSEEVVEALGFAARSMSADVTGPAASAGWKLRPYAWIPAAGGGVLAAVGTVLAVQANERMQELSAWREEGAPVSFYGDQVWVAEEGKAAQGIAIGAYAVGGALLGVAGYMFLTGSPPAPGAVTLVPAPGGAAVVWSWP